MSRPAKELAVRYQYAPSWKERAAFTLIEILVVIAIIAILASLLLVGVMSFLVKGPEAKARNDILQLSSQLQKFKSERGFYPPDSIILKPNRSGPTGYNVSIPLEKSSLLYLTAMWPNLGDFTSMAWAGFQANGTTPVQTPPAPNSYWVLEGDQCLVFFLGGIPDANGKVTGFSNNPKNPTQAGGDRIKWFDFDAGRLSVTYHTGSPFPAYTDAFGKKPYLYFSSGKRENDYNSTNGTFAVSPYIETAGTRPKYWNSTTFQVLCAGNDGIFGSGGLWPATSIPKAAMDDYSNFHDRKLGSPP